MPVIGTFIGGTTGAILGGLSGMLSGGCVGAKAGDLVDENIISRYRCNKCDREFEG